ncbi:hypothetical protein ABW21_db0206924 [Orbilia brochopaga]|nr:hypothetical protein ABW21_db0206924 [Drechslerella brochopaga]
MHELTLFAHVSKSRVAQIQRALTTITGMPAAPLLEHHLLYKPKRNRQTASGGASASSGAGPASSAGGGDFYYLKLIADILGSCDQTRKDPVASETHTPDRESTHKNSDSMEIDQAASTIISGTSGPPKSSGNYDARKQRWAIRFSDLPEVNNKRPVTSRMIHHATISDGDALSFVECLGYMYVGMRPLSMPNLANLT